MMICLEITESGEEYGRYYQICFAMLPGVGSQLKNVEGVIDEMQFSRIEAIILSMTPQERANPDLINPSRKKRIAQGAGVDISEVNKLAKHA